MQDYISVYDVCKKFIKDNGFKYMVYIHDKCAYRLPEYTDKIKYAQNIPDIAQEVINIMKYILEESNISFDLINKDMHDYYINLQYDYFSDCEIFHFINDNKSYDYIIKLFNINKEEYLTIINIIKKHFKLN